jgi:hypothetical protein
MSKSISHHPPDINGSIYYNSITSNYKLISFLTKSRKLIVSRVFGFRLGGSVVPDVHAVEILVTVRSR